MKEEQNDAIMLHSPTVEFKMKTKEEQNDAIMPHRLGRGMLCLIQALITNPAEQGEYLE